ncbi:Bacterial membrane flanked domain protein [Nocardioides dokdonensis FR1436]|uniref:Bacterial membrane flanked domain protein n=1 Tax=Nocardioides dokdonensis FR1436 TaxID=1300347 RepID=A0A1A9GEG6_9ACTN|nr:PH domain-containing protein [Nocardioides dokdonensis]ANH36634.1 Bacterial membrane flanked domain protein [Nocardioides dokdonensis FR1436]
MPINRSLLNDGENVVVSTRTHPKALLLPLLVLVLLLALGSFVEVRTSGDGGRVVAWVVWAVVALGVLRFVLWPFLVWLTGSYTFTDRRLITRTGVLTRRGHDIPISRISDVAVELHLIDRMLGCGTLVVSDASTHGQVSLPDIPRVEEVQRRLNALLHGHSGRGEGA